MKASARRSNDHLDVYMVIASILDRKIAIKEIGVREEIETFIEHTKVAIPASEAGRLIVASLKRYQMETGEETDILQTWVERVCSNISKLKLHKAV